MYFVGCLYVSRGVRGVLVTKRSSEKCLPIKISHSDHSSIGCQGVEKEPHANKV
jgi:hypothetical protein